MIHTESVFCYSHSLCKCLKSCLLSRLCLRMLDLQQHRVSIQRNIVSGAWQQRFQLHEWMHQEKEILSYFLELKQVHSHILGVWYSVKICYRSILRLRHNMHFQNLAGLLKLSCFAAKNIANIIIFQRTVYSIAVKWTAWPPQMLQDFWFNPELGSLLQGLPQASLVSSHHPKSFQ